MTTLIALLAQGLHVALMLLVAPTLAGALAKLDARLDGHTGAPVLQAWRDLLRLTRKRPVPPESASLVSRVGPAACLVTTAAAAALVPSFSLGMTLAPIGDLLVIAGLLALSRTTEALVALDAGTTRGGMLASQGMRRVVFGEPALLLAVFTLALLAGSSNLDLIVGLQREGLMQPAAASALAAAALVAVALAWQPDGPDPERAGTALAITRLTDALGILVWLDLLGALFLPIGIAEVTNGFAGWPLGLLVWAAKLAVLAVALVAARRLLDGRRPRAVAELLAIAGLFGLIAAVFALASASAA